MNDYKKLIGELQYGFPDAGTVQSKLIRDAADAIEQLVKERDAAVSAMEHIANSALFPCEYCTQDCTAIENCKTGEAKFKWRGVQEVEHE